MAQLQTLVERLGYGADARLLIVHADDLGLAPSVNTAFAEGHKSGLINSGSAMVPCIGFGEIAAFARSHKQADIGLHLVLTSANVADRWGPVAPLAEVPSLVDQQGYFHERWTSATPINLEDVKRELRSQIDRAIENGLHPTHLDSHQYLLQKKNAKLFEIFIQLGRDYDLPLLISREWFAAYPYLQTLTAPSDIVLDRTATIGPMILPENWTDFYRNEIQQLPAGISEVLIHPAHDTKELQAFFQGREDWGAAWRQRDLDFFTSGDFSALLHDENIQLVTWGEIASRLR